MFKGVKTHQNFMAEKVSETENDVWKLKVIHCRFSLIIYMHIDMSSSNRGVRGYGFASYRNSVEEALVGLENATAFQAEAILFNLIISVNITLLLSHCSY